MSGSCVGSMCAICVGVVVFLKYQCNRQQRCNAELLHEQLEPRGAEPTNTGILINAEAQQM